MGKCAKGKFIGEVPEMYIDGGLVHLVSGRKHYYMRPSVVRRYAIKVQALLAKWDCEQMGAVPMRRK